MAKKTKPKKVVKKPVAKIAPKKKVVAKKRAAAEPKKQYNVKCRVCKKKFVSNDQRDTDGDASCPRCTDKKNAIAREVDKKLAKDPVESLAQRAAMKQAEYAEGRIYLDREVDMRTGREITR